MAIPNFNYLAPATLKEALTMRISHGAKSSIMAGGTDLLIKMAHRNHRPEYIIGLNNVANIDYVRYNDKGDLSIGPMTKLSTIMDHPEVVKHFSALSHSSGVTATVQIRNMSTLIGNIVNASPSADNATPLLVLDAHIVIMHEGGERTVPLHEFFLGFGNSVMKPNELIKEMILPLPEKNSGSSYQKISTRSKVDIAGVCVSAFLTLNDEGVITIARIALGSVAPKPIRITQAEQMLVGQKPSTELFKKAAAMSKEEAKPISDMRASADYRKAMVEVLTIRALEASLLIATNKSN
jgi:carbon-monoxide dehydrogenase medium subunit